MEDKPVCKHCNSIVVDNEDFVIKDKSFSDLVKSVDRKDKNRLGKEGILKWLLENATPKSLTFFEVIETVQYCLNCSEEEMVEVLKQNQVFVQFKKSKDDKDQYDAMKNENLAAEFAINNGKPEILLWILKLDCNKNVYQNELNFLLLHAAREDKLEHVKILVKYGANLVGKVYKDVLLIECVAGSASIDIMKWIVSSNTIVKNHPAYVRALFGALQSKQFDVVEYLIENTEIDLNMKIIDSDNKNKLTNNIQEAAKIGNINLILWLLEKGAKLFVGNDKKTIVNIAAKNGHVNLLKWLCIQGGDIISPRSGGKTLLHLAAEKGHLDCVKYLVHKKFDVNAKDKENESVLHCAVASKNIELVKFLIDHGANALVEDNTHNTLLHKAHDSLEMLQLLVPLGIDLHVKNTSHLNVLNLAAEHKNYDVVCWLLKQGMNIKDVEKCAKNWLLSDRKENHRMLNLCLKYVNESDDKKFHPALLVTAAWFIEAFQILVQNNASFDVDNDSSTPLIESLLQYIDQNYTTAHYLLEQGVDVTYKSLKNGDALYVSIRKKQLAITKKIVELGGDVNTQVYDGYTALGLTISMHYMEAFEYLLSKGADINAEDSSRRTVLHVVFETVPVYDMQILLLKYLIIRGADPNYYNSDHKPMLCKASENQDTEFALWLLSNGADANLTVRDSGPIVFECLNNIKDENKKLEFVSLFLSHGLQINIVNFQNENLLFPCIENLQIVDYLIRQGIDVNFVNINSCSALHEALHIKHYENDSHNQIKIVMKLLYNGADITIANGVGQTPLHLAVFNKHCSDIARVLVQRGANLNAKDTEGNSVLHDTCQGELAMWLCEQGARINAKNDHGVSVLHSVIQRLPDKEEQKNLNIVPLIENCAINNSSRKQISAQYLASIDSSRYFIYLEFLLNKVDSLEERDDNGMTVLHYAVEKDNTSLLNMLVEKGVNILSKSRYGETVLHLAASAGSLSVVTYILEHMKHELLLKGNDANDTPLHLAVISSHVNIVKLLLKHGVDVNQKNDQNMTALHLACRNGNLEIIKLLLSNGANMYVTSIDSYAPIHMAIIHCNFDVFECLLEFESQNPNSEPNVKLLELKTDLDENLLHVAAKYGRLRNVPTKIMQYLISKQVYPIDKVDKLGNSALHYACSTYVIDAVELLVNNGANINLKNKTGNTPLHFAAKTAREDIIQYLMLQGGNSKVKNKKGNTPIHIAVANKHTEIISYLVDKSVELLDVKNRKGNSVVHVAAAVDVQLNSFLFRFKAGGIDDSHVNYNTMNLKNQSPLSFAAKYVSKRMVVFRSCITKETVNAKDKYGDTPLHVFFKTKKPMHTGYYIRYAYELCKNGGDLLAKNKLGQTAMHLAIQYSYSDIPILLPYVTDVNVTDESGHNILHAALYNMELDVIQPLFSAADINAKTSDGETYLHIVINNYRREVLDWLVPQCRSIINEKDYVAGDTALLKCVKYSVQLSVIQLFVDNGADIHAVDNSNQSVIEISELTGRADLVDYFNNVLNN